MKTHYQILVIGGGTAGIMTAAQLLRKDKTLDVGIIEPADTHYYQPAWTLVAAGTFDFKKTAKPMMKVIPKGATWIRDMVVRLNPEQNSVSTQGEGDITYDYLVVAPGLVMKLSLIEGLAEAIGRGVACSIYTDPEATWEQIRNFKGGNAIFTQPGTPIKCGGAPQKIAYLAADHFRKRGVASKTKQVFATPGTVIFGIKAIRKTLEKVIKRYNIDFKPFHTPVKIDPDKKVVYFEKRFKDKTKVTEMVAMPFDLLHLAPPQVAPEFISESVLSNEKGWLEVDKHSMQNQDFPNIFGLGDVAGLPTAKTGAAIRKQVPVVVDNIRKLIDHQQADNHDYQGYSSCPLVTGYGKMTLAEFDYEGNFTPDPKLKQMLVFDSAKEHWRLWLLKKYGLPYLYWQKMLKGKEV